MRVSQGPGEQLLPSKSARERVLSQRASLVLAGTRIRAPFSFTEAPGCEENRFRLCSQPLPWAEQRKERICPLPLCGRRSACPQRGAGRFLCSQRTPVFLPPARQPLKAHQSL